MRNLLGSLLCWILLFSLFPSAAASSDIPSAVEKFKGNVVRVSSDQEAGFGFIIGKRNSKYFVVTANHVVRSMDDNRPFSEIKVTFYHDQGRRHSADLLGVHEAGPQDLALLEVAVSTSAPTLDGCTAVSQDDFGGTPVWFIGRKGKFTVPSGDNRINDARPDGDDLFSFETTSVKRGTSGAPLIGEDGLLGMIVSDDGRSESHAVSITYIQKMVRNWNYPWTIAECRNSVADACSESRSGIRFTRIPSGEFFMGSAEGEPDEQPVRRVRINQDFCLGSYEVTQQQWEAVMGSGNPSRYSAPDRPVENVTWYEVQEFLVRLGKLDQATYRLPTEAEWEYAARAGRSNRGPHRPKAVAWFDSNSGQATQSIGRKAANPWGLHDMVGNVWEWVQDYYAEYPQYAQDDPSGPRTGEYRVVRGGSWRFGITEFTFRNNVDPSVREPDVGFRVVRSIQKGEK